MMINIEIPESHDPEWQADMIFMLYEKVISLRDEFDPEGHSREFRESLKILESLREYSGY